MEQELYEVTQKLLREVVDERDCLYESHTDAFGEFAEDDDRAECQRLDTIIDEAQAVIRRYESQQSRDEEQ